MDPPPPPTIAGVIAWSAGDKGGDNGGGGDEEEETDRPTSNRGGLLSAIQGMFIIKYFSLYLVYVQCEVFALLTFNVMSVCDPRVQQDAPRGCGGGGRSTE